MTAAVSDLRRCGRAWVFGDEVNTDEMFPGFAMKMSIAEAARHMFNATRPGWPDLVQPGDLVVGGRNFGMGSSRPVPLLFKELGVGGIVAEEFNSLFLRNCVNYGLPALAVAGIREKVAEGQNLCMDLPNASVENTTTGEKLYGGAFPEFILEIIAGGGVLAKLENDGLLQKASSEG
ncbi:MAG: 3-isopropylmalate dehydratase [Streptosporangiales bacterium]|nr:3-isopropylmalate dehydratase [Streptosporangiales bacterium]